MASATIPTILDIPLTRGDSKTFDVFCRKPDPTIGILLPIDLTGAKVWFTAKRFITDPDQRAKIQVSIAGGGILLISAPGGQVRVTIPAGATSPPNLPDDVIALVYDVQVLETSGALTTVQRGSLNVTPDVTLTTSVSPDVPSVFPIDGVLQIVADMPALELFFTTPLSDVCLCVVQSPRRLYCLNKNPATPPGPSGSDLNPPANPSGSWDFVMAL